MPRSSETGTNASSAVTGTLRYQKPPSGADGDDGVLLTGSTISRVIGVKGSGVTRITSEVRRRFPGSGPYIRADRATKSFALTTRGRHGDKALRLLSDMLKAEIAWITGSSAVCPHPIVDLAEPDNKALIKHIIGQRGKNLRALTDHISRGEHGPGCFIVHKPDLCIFRIEGVATAQVELGARRLQELIDDITQQQTPKVIELEGEAADTAAAARRGHHRAVAAEAAAVDGDTNSFDALASSGDDDDEDEDEDEDEDDKQKRSPGNKSSRLEHGFHVRSPAAIEARDFHRLKSGIAKELGIPFYRVSDRLVQQAMRDEERSNASASGGGAAAAPFDAVSSEEFPSVSGGGENIKLTTEALAPASAWSLGTGAAASSEAVKPPPPAKRPSLTRQMTGAHAAFLDPRCASMSPLPESTSETRKAKNAGRDLLMEECAEAIEVDAGDAELAAAEKWVASSSSPAPPSSPASPTIFPNLSNRSWDSEDETE